MRRTCRWLFILIVLAACLAAGPARVYAAGAPGCKNANDGNHYNRDGTAEESVAPTCTEDGYDVYTCLLCNEKFKVKTQSALGHSMGDWHRDKEPSCTQAGRDVRRCSRCGKTESRDVAALGHDWDDGVVQGDPEAFLHDNEVLYTCRRCGATHTEEVKFTMMSLWPTLYNDPITDPDYDLLDPLTITKQPEDLSIVWEEGNTGTLTITAEGGLIPYTYRWIVVPGTGSAGILGSSFIDVMNIAGADLSEACSMVASFGELEERKRGYAIAKPAAVGALSSFWQAGAEPVSQMEAADKAAYEFVPDNAVVTETMIPECEVTVGDAKCYTAWCVVIDKKGKYVTSDKVQIHPSLTIISQPRDINMDDPEAAFSVAAAYGKEPYTYQWQYNIFATEEFEDIDSPDAQADTLKHIPGMDTVRCVVTDDNGDSVVSESADAFVAPVLYVSAEEKIDSRPGEEAKLSAAFHGGTAPYTARWEKCSGGNTGILKTYEFEEDPEDTPIEYGLDTSDSGAYGSYRFTVEDSVGQIKDVLVRYDYRDLTILEQPESGQLSFEGKFDVRIVMGEGSLPFTYTVKDLNNADVVTETLSASEWSTTVTSSGFYYMYVTDANGLHARSEFFCVDDYEVRIVSQPEWIEIEEPHHYAEAEILIQGGEGPYDLLWMKLNEETGGYEPIWTTEGSDPNLGYGDGTVVDMKTDGWARLLTVVRGTYLLVARDANDVMCTSKPFDALYVGTVPYITVQPQDAEYEATSGRSNLFYTLDCEGRTGMNDYLAYLWEYYAEDGTWQNVELQTMYSRDSWFHGPFYADYPHQEFRYVDHSCAYRCKVTNTVTGEYAYSRVALVKVLMHCTHYGQRGDHTALHAQFAGGAWPFTFEIRERFPTNFDSVQQKAGTDGDNRSYTRATFIQHAQQEYFMDAWWKDPNGEMHFNFFDEFNIGVPNARKEVFESTIDGTLYCDATGIARRYRLPYDPDGSKSSAGAHDYYHRVYQVMAVDRFGDTCTCPWIRMTSPMTTSEKAWNIFFTGIFGVHDGDHNGW
ncbi:MAG: hypothetical protein IIY46_07570 [Lachnospiraceae bacterium]|nr:hypothetical protein [Lachnospiraceae bacterium]